MPAQLVSLGDGPNILLDKPIVLIGRHEECDVQLNSRKVSRKHCCIAQVNDYLVVRDLGSTNGVRINGVRTQEGSLRVGDELTIGNHRYQVSLDGPPTSPAPAWRDGRTEPRPPSAVDSGEIPIPIDEAADSRAPVGRPPSGMPVDLPMSHSSSIHPPQRPV